MIAAALLADPKLLIADEPTTALDVTTQEEVVAIMDRLRREQQLGLVFITHDLDLAAAITDRIAVMYAGTIVESGPSTTLTTAPRHPYTAGLLRSRPSATLKRPLQPIPGRPLAAFEVGSGCPFADRCAFATPTCRQDVPALRPLAGHLVACHRAEEVADALTIEQDGPV
jgi:oligopeptide/dipeptide ABC transporter ATP-binding protein